MTGRDEDISVVVLTDEEIKEEIMRQLENEPATFTRLVLMVVDSLKARGYDVSPARVRRLAREVIENMW